MFFNVDIKGNGLPRKTLCFTYDDGPGETPGDGPGPRTKELGQYLREYGVPATFFVIGKHAERHRDILRTLQACGHLLGNHTYTHPGLVDFVRNGGDPEVEVAKTDEIINGHAAQGVLFFRPPYGNWRERSDSDPSVDKATSPVAAPLNSTRWAEKYVGPINWDLSGHDYDYWKENRTAEDCAHEYLARIEQAESGIVLMHDSSEDCETRIHHLTLETTRCLVPVLKSKGYRFIRLDRVPQVESAARVRRQIALEASSGEYLSAHPTTREISFGGCIMGAQHQFGVVPLGRKRIALRAADGRYVCVKGRGNGLVGTGAFTIKARHTWIMEELNGGWIALRTLEGFYMCRDPQKARLLATTRRVGDAEPLSVTDLFKIP
jgi:peptidoglycan/xylan/chitin deacetylase (PgdA/CDA1 family)